jgi:non-heme chloroperoxidase
VRWERQYLHQRCSQMASPKFFYRIIDQLALCIPNHKRAIIEGSSHTVPGEKPDAFDSAALAFFELH